jgi:hypothetical protein
MRLRNFVSASSVILAGWLLVTFFRDVPSQRYPKLQKHVRSASVSADMTESKELPESNEPADFQVSASR